MSKVDDAINELSELVAKANEMARNGSYTFAERRRFLTIATLFLHAEEKLVAEQFNASTGVLETSTSELNRTCEEIKKRNGQYKEVAGLIEKVAKAVNLILQLAAKAATL
ncbi:hypothetical protein [Fundidesulfovibrio agrisoli]|uniref:hypothetical protein n=1 Tax=Fundidesulfovibrio agrisoli TaxID=2922717 RepID=UPI001FAE2830|nr:hypothetical protein [Fundidesulfovibrio agrisoli]